MNYELRTIHGSVGILPKNARLASKIPDFIGNSDSSCVLRIEYCVNNNVIAKELVPQGRSDCSNFPSIICKFCIFGTFCHFLALFARKNVPGTLNYDEYKSSFIKPAYVKRVAWPQVRALRTSLFLCFYFGWSYNVHFKLVE
jgi:hypothetical protein